MAKKVKKEKKVFSTKAPVPPMMKSVGLTWLGVQDLAQHCVDILRESGEDMVVVVGQIMKLIKAISDRDYGTIFALIQDTSTNIKDLIKAIKAEFGLE